MISTICQARRRFLERHVIPNAGIELLVYVYYAALAAFVVVASVVFWGFFAADPALTLLVAAVVGFIIWRRLRGTEVAG